MHLDDASEMCRVFSTALIQIMKDEWLGHDHQIRWPAVKGSAFVPFQPLPPLLHHFCTGDRDLNGLLRSSTMAQGEGKSLGLPGP